jgi:hypothetical protein
VNVCSVLSLFVTVSVTFPEATFTESGLNAKFCAVTVALEAPPPEAVELVAAGIQSLVEREPTGSRAVLDQTDPAAAREVARRRQGPG